MLNKKLYLILLLLWSFNVDGKTSNILKLSCEYDPNLIKKESKDGSLNDNQEVNITVLCKSFGCNDVVEVNKNVITMVKLNIV